MKITPLLTFALTTAKVDANLRGSNQLNKLDDDASKRKHLRSLVDGTNSSRSLTSDIIASSRSQAGGSEGNSSPLMIPSCDFPYELTINTDSFNNPENYEIEIELLRDNNSKLLNFREMIIFETKSENLVSLLIWSIILWFIDISFQFLPETEYIKF